jgi:CDGSH-type Zn-finger protein
MKEQPVIAKTSPYALDVEAGKSYYWCSCGRSKQQPLCDGSHAGTGFEPLLFTAQKTETMYLCGCKHSFHPPLCDGTHRSLLASADTLPSDHGTESL